MIRHRQLLVGFALVLLLGLAVTAEIPLHEFEQALHGIPVNDIDAMLGAIELGFGQPDFPAEQLLRLIDRLAGRPAPAIEKEAVLRVITHAIEEGLPIEGMVDKAFEGLARSVPMAQLENGLQQLHILLAEIRDLLYSRGIFSAGPGAQSTAINALPIERFNLLVLHISEAIDSYLSGGGSPFESQLLFEEVHERLTQLQGVILDPMDVELVFERINPSDLTQVALTAVS